MHISLHIRVCLWKGLTVLIMERVIRELRISAGCNQELERRGSTVQDGVDGTKLAESLFGERFEAVIFNFPYGGATLGEGGFFQHISWQEDILWLQIMWGVSLYQHLQRGWNYYYCSFLQGVWHLILNRMTVCRAAECLHAASAVSGSSQQANVFHMDRLWDGPLLCLCS